MKRLIALCLLACGSAQAAISFVAVEDTIVSVASTDWTCDLPAGTQDNDILIFAFSTNSTAVVNTTPMGVTVIANQAPAGDASVVVAWKVAASESDPVDFTGWWSATESGQCVTIAYRGVDTMSPIVASNSDTQLATTSISGPAVDTTGTDGAMIVHIIGSDPSTVVTGTPDASPTASERYDLYASGFIAYTYIQDYLQPTGASIALDVTDLLSDDYGAFQVALNPAAGGGGLTQISTLQNLSKGFGPHKSQQLGGVLESP